MRTLDSVERIAQDFWQPDLAWCQANGLEWLRVVFPGFGWHSMNPRSALDHIPRPVGRLLWKQFHELRRVGASMVYQGMFDEATAVFICTNNPHACESTLLDYEGLPNDHYLWLAGLGRSLIRNETPRQRSFRCAMNRRGSGRRTYAGSAPVLIHQVNGALATLCEPRRNAAYTTAEIDHDSKGPPYHAFR